MDILILIGFVVVYIFSSSIFSNLTVSELEKFRIVFIIAGLYALSSFPFQPLNGILISHEKFIFLKITELFYRVLTVATMVVVLILGYKLYALIVVSSVVGILIIVAKLIYIKSLTLKSGFFL